MHRRGAPSAAVLDTITEIARQKVGFEGDLRPEMRLVEDLALDSLRLLTLAVEVEDRFRVCLDEADEARVETVGDLVDLVVRKLAESGDAPGAEDRGGTP